MQEREGGENTACETQTAKTKRYEKSKRTNLLLAPPPSMTTKAQHRFSSSSRTKYTLMIPKMNRRKEGRLRRLRARKGSRSTLPIKEGGGVEGALVEGEDGMCGE